MTWRIRAVYSFILLMTVFSYRTLIKNLKNSEIKSRFSISSNNQVFPSKNEKFEYSFGIIADIQYADADDSLNFQQTKTRRYRQSLDIFSRATKEWSLLSSQIQSTVVLGDMIDARAGFNKTQHTCLSRIMKICQESSIPNYHFCIGNHCHYNFKRSELYEHLIAKYMTKSELGESKKKLGDDFIPLHYDWSPYPGWRFLFLDSYDVSLIGHSSEENRMIAAELLQENNPNDLKQSGTWFKNLPFHKKRWVPYNGMISMEQKEWLRNKLHQTVNNEEKVIIFCHQPVYSPLKPSSLVWNSEEILEILHESGNVCLWMAGHDHDGNYCQDSKGIHHLIPPAPIEAEIGEVAYGHIDVYSDKFILNWHGKLPTHSPMPWPTEMMIIPSNFISKNLDIKMIL